MARLKEKEKEAARRVPPPTRLPPAAPVAKPLPAIPVIPLVAPVGAPLAVAGAVKFSELGAPTIPANIQRAIANAQTQRLTVQGILGEPAFSDMQPIWGQAIQAATVELGISAVDAAVVIANIQVMDGVRGAYFANGVMYISRTSLETLKAALATPDQAINLGAQLYNAAAEVAHEYVHSVMATMKTMPNSDSAISQLFGKLGYNVPVNFSQLTSAGQAMLEEAATMTLATRVQAAIGQGPATSQNLITTYLDAKIGEQEIADIVVGPRQSNIFRRQVKRGLLPKLRANQPVTMADALNTILSVHSVEQYSAITDNAFERTEDISDLLAANEPLLAQAEAMPVVDNIVDLVVSTFRDMQAAGVLQNEANLFARIEQLIQPGTTTELGNKISLFIFLKAVSKYNVEARRTGIQPINVPQIAYRGEQGYDIDGLIRTLQSELEFTNVARFLAEYLTLDKTNIREMTNITSLKLLIAMLNRTTRPDILSIDFGRGLSAAAAATAVEDFDELTSTLGRAIVIAA